MPDQALDDAEPLHRDSVRPAGADDGARRFPVGGAGAAQPAARRRPRWGFIVLGLVVVAGAVLGGLWWFAHRNEVSTDDAFTDGHAITIAPRVAGNVIALAVRDNQFVHAGQLLIKIDPSDFIATRDQISGQLEAAEAQLANARANLAIQRITQPAKLAAAQAQLASAQANEVKAARDYARFHAINPAATTRQDIDTATAAQRQAAAAVAQAQAQVEQASTVPLDIRQAEAQIRQLQGQIAQITAQLNQANLNLGYTNVVAPQDGWITQRNVELGNYAQVGAAVFSIVTPQVWVVANFKEDELTRLRAGQHVRIHVDAYPWLKLEGHVDSIQLGSGSKFSAFPAENATGNFVKIVQRVPVKIDIDRGLDPNLPLPLGISVEPVVDVR
jgi:membrane fusion protein (multidrug efflux system)